MDLTPRIPEGRQVINGYGDSGFRIAGRRHEGSVIVLPTHTVEWPVGRPDEITADSLQPVMAAEPQVELLLLGLGPQIRHVPAALRAALKARGIVVEGLDTGAAARTYNVLLGESRRVAAALIAI
ncbi:MAG: Mth938-like domain-containing protein [Sneathiellaceae bacterium]